MRDRGRLLDALGVAAVAAGIGAFARSWIGHPLLLDGPGVATWLELAVRHVERYGRIGYWFPEVWGGTPVWALAPSFHIVWLVPLAQLLDAEAAIKIAAVLAQAVAGAGAYVLARSLVRDRTAAAVAGIVYGLHPIVLSHLVLFGHAPGVWVIAATPWFAWSLRHALRDGRPRMIGLAGLFAGFTLLQQGEHAYAVILLAAVYVGVALIRRAADRRLVLVRAGAVAALAVALAAFWILPFARMQSSFALTPDTDVRSFLRHGLAGEIAARPGVFFQRSPGRSGPAPMETDTVLEEGNFSLGWVALALTAVGIALLPGRDRDGFLAGTLLAGALGIWLSSAAVPLALSAPALNGQILPFIGIGIAIGVLFGTLVLRDRARRWLVVGVGAAGAVFAALPYIAPFEALQRVVPFLDAVRWPRFYALAPLAVALGTAITVAAGVRWLRDRPAVDGIVAIAVGALVVASVLVDVSGLRSLYGSPPEPGLVTDHREAAAAIAADERRGIDRTAVYAYWDPVTIRTLLDEGLQLANGWPHPVASSGAYAFAAESWRVPGDHRMRAMGMLSTTHVVTPPASAPPGERIAQTEGHVVLRNGFAQPLIRAYGAAAVVEDGTDAELLALALAPRGVTAVTGGREIAEDLGLLTVAFDPASGPAVGAERDALEAEVARARSTGRWYGRYLDTRDLLTGDRSAGAILRPDRDGLAGVSVVTFGGPRTAVLTLQEVAPDGRALGRVVRQSFNRGPDELGFHLFAFEPIPDSAGKRYALTLSCPTCEPRAAPRLAWADAAEHEEGDLVYDGRLDRDHIAAVVPVYERMPAVDRPTLRWRARQGAPGAWDVDASADRPVLVVLSEAFFPGWRATVDGRDTPVVRADGALLGVPMPAGEHRIEFRFRPPPAVGIGRGISVAALLVVAVLLLSPGRRAPRLLPRPRPRDEIVDRLPVGVG